MKRKLACALAVMLTVAAFGALPACGKDDSGNGEIKYEKVLSSQAKKELAADEECSFTLNEKLKNKEYLRLVVKTNVHLFGTFTYVNESEPSKEITEDFFIEQSKRFRCLSGQTMQLITFFEHGIKRFSF